MTHSVENDAGLMDALARVPRCAWHMGQYPDLCWWCGLNRVIPPEGTDHEL